MSRTSALNLVQWLRGLGGFVDERLAVAVGASGSRGLVATSPIPETSRPLVAIPEPLVLTPEAALFSLGTSGVLTEAGVASLAGYASAAGDPAAPISLVLAADAALRMARRGRGAAGRAAAGFERGGGWRMSPWGAYTASLPPPPLFSNNEGEEEEGRNSSSGSSSSVSGSSGGGSSDGDSSGSGGCAGWFLPLKAREAALARSFPSASRRRRISRALDEALRIEREAAEATFAAAFPGRRETEDGSFGKGGVGVTVQLLTWARSQVVSRAFAAPAPPSSSSSSSVFGDGQVVPALLPVLDLCNHSPRGGFPAWGVVSDSVPDPSPSAAAAAGGGAPPSSSSSSSSPPPPPPSRLCWLRNASPLSEGEELTTDYSRLCGGDGGAWISSYGFVPAEAM